jgi:hypothetical protein
MAKNSVYLKVAIAKKDFDKLMAEVDSGDQSRRALISYIIVMAIDRQDNLTIAKSAVSRFNLTGKDPVGSSRSLVTRVINELNQGVSVDQILEKRGGGSLQLNRWTNEKIISSLLDIHDSLGGDFSYAKIIKSHPALISTIENKGNFREFLEMANIDPVCHLSDFRWNGYGDPKLTIKKVIQKIAEVEGFDKLNVHTVENSSYDYPLKQFVNPQYIACHSCKPPALKGGTLHMSIRTYFENWREAVKFSLDLSDQEYDEKIERKKLKIGWYEYYKVFEGYLNEVRSSWSVIDFCNRFPVEHHGLHNNRHELPFFEHCHHDAMKAAYAQYLYLRTDSDDIDKFWGIYYDIVNKNFRNKRKTDPRSRMRGYEFQELFLKMLTSPDVGLVDGVDFQHETAHAIENCEAAGHIERCRPDFRFANFWLDTKTTVSSGERIVKQIQRYLTHTNRLIIVTLNQRSHSAFDDIQAVDIITIKDFIGESERYIGRNVPLQWINEFDAWISTLNSQLNQQEVSSSL